jgi:hypothetical protein
LLLYIQKGNGVAWTGLRFFVHFGKTSSCLHGYQDMKFKVNCLYEDGTLILPEELRRVPIFVGSLLLTVKDDVVKGSIILEARLVNATQLDLLPALSDVEVVSGDNGDILVRGHYYKTKYRLPRRQSWFLVPTVRQ